MVLVRSQNGLTANDRSLIRSATMDGTDVKVAVRKGPVGDLLLAVAARWNREVEPLRAKDGVLDTWGYAERLIRGSSTSVSNHASGSALDFRARIHLLGTNPAASYSQGQIAAIHRIVADCRGALRWGGDYTGRKDPMHVEVIATETACSRVLATFPPSAGMPVQVAPAIPLPPPSPEEDDVDIRITPDQSGDFRSAAKVEIGGDVGYRAAYLSLSTTWGETDFAVTALDSNGAPTALGDRPFRLPTNAHWVVQLPPATRTVTVEGHTFDRGTVPVAALWHVR